MAKGDKQKPQVDARLTDKKRGTLNLDGAVGDLDSLQTVLDQLQSEQSRAEPRPIEQAQYDQKQFDQLAFVDGSLDALKANMNGLAWCASCHVISRMADWWTQDKCPHCREPVFARFAWSDLRRINPQLPESPEMGKPFLMDDEKSLVL